MIHSLATSLPVPPGLCKLYEDVLKELNPAEPRMTYDLNDMLRYIDTFPEIIIMAPDSRTRLYTAHDRNWIKQSVVSHLQSIASQR
ncbi:hypothetical protein H632_c891p0 [Helicosporidium sp. ATCC 50920]|nr:hypothetical protein H632_c891p0 [Helicosporidium sp. ATCC 50920]|eukprot:KDD75068.1 hypothetical protein H632_c891p0 [Helicosporidium sp. ATCC 50920]